MQVCENNWVTRIVGVNRADTRSIRGRTEARRWSEGKKKLSRHRLKHGGHMERMENAKLAEKVEGREEDRYCDGRTALRRSGRMGKERRITETKDRRCWRLLLENVEGK